MISFYLNPFCYLLFNSYSFFFRLICYFFRVALFSLPSFIYFLLSTTLHKLNMHSTERHLIDFMLLFILCFFFLNFNLKMLLQFKVELKKFKNKLRMETRGTSSRYNINENWSELELKRTKKYWLTLIYLFIFFT